MAKEQFVVKETEGKPGHFESPLKEYPGYIQFPNPLTLPQVKAWWLKAVEPLKEITQLDWDYQTAEWNGARELLLTYGEWAIKGVSEADVKTDNVPALVSTFVVEAANVYVPPFLPSRALRRLRAVT